MGVTWVARRIPSDESAFHGRAEREAEQARGTPRSDARGRPVDLAAPVAARTISISAGSWANWLRKQAPLLVGGAVALGTWVMTAAQETTGVYVTSNAVAPGDRVSAQQLSVVQVRGEHIHEHYLIADETLPAEAVALRVLAAGEFIPRSAIGDAQLMLDRPIAIPMSTSLSKNVTAGSLADLWFVPDVSATVSNGASPEEAPTSEPRQLAAGLVVAEITENSGLMARSGLSVHVLVPTDLLPAVLGALAAPGTVSLVPVPGALS